MSQFGSAEILEGVCVGAIGERHRDLGPKPYSDRRLPSILDGHGIPGRRRAPVPSELRARCSGRQPAADHDATRVGGVRRCRTIPQRRPVRTMGPSPAMVHQWVDTVGAATFWSRRSPRPSTPQEPSRRSTTWRRLSERSLGSQGDWSMILVGNATAQSDRPNVVGLTQNLAAPRQELLRPQRGVSILW
jgi:hypothetical protein